MGYILVKAQPAQEFTYGDCCIIEDGVARHMKFSELQESEFYIVAGHVIDENGIMPVFTHDASCQVQINMSSSGHVDQSNQDMMQINSIKSTTALDDKVRLPMRASKYSQSIVCGDHSMSAQYEYGWRNPRDMSLEELIADWNKHAPAWNQAPPEQPSNESEDVG